MNDAGSGQAASVEDDTRSAQPELQKHTAGRHAAVQQHVAQSISSHAPMLTRAQAPESFTAS